MKFRSLMTICLVVSVLFAVAPAMATYIVDLGTTNGISDPGINLSGWGEAESGGGAAGRDEGSYGGIGIGNCRMVWGYSEDDTADWAEITYPTDITSVTIKHLDGSQFDSFDVIVGGILWGSYTGVGGGENWLSTIYSGDAGSTLLIDITSNASTWRLDWGQLGIDRVEATPIPEPATIALLGLGGIALLRRRKKK